MNARVVITIEGIINGIGSPWGEGATYYNDLGGTSHLDEDDKHRLRADLKLLEQQAYQKGWKDAEKNLANVLDEIKALQTTTEKGTG